MKSLDQVFLSFDEFSAICVDIWRSNRLHYHFNHNPCAIYIADILFKVVGDPYEKIAHELNFPGLISDKRQKSVENIFKKYGFLDFKDPENFDVVLINDSGSEGESIGIYHSKHVIYLNLSCRVKSRHIDDFKKLTYHRMVYPWVGQQQR